VRLPPLLTAGSLYSWKATTHMLLLLLLLLACAEGSQPPSSASFVCCSGQDSCGGVVNSQATCAVLGEFYAATGGVSWSNNHGWAAAAAGTPTNLCSFFGAGCIYGDLTLLCAAHFFRPLGDLCGLLCRQVAAG
jgi:hypothetical protein